MNITELPIWEKVKGYAYAEPYSNQSLKNGAARRRLWVSSEVPTVLKNKMLKAKVNCCACNKKIKAFREAHGYPIRISVSCPLEKSVACSRKIAKGTGKKFATIEYDKIRASIEDRPYYSNPNQMNLFS